MPALLMYSRADRSSTIRSPPSVQRARNGSSALLKLSELTWLMRPAERSTTVSARRLGARSIAVSMRLGLRARTPGGPAAGSVILAPPPGSRRFARVLRSRQNTWMTERKPPDKSWKSWVEEQIQHAQQEGTFDDLEGKGRPIPGIDAPYD